MYTVRFTTFEQHFEYFLSEHPKFTSARGSSSAWEQRCHLPQGRRTCFRCSVASDQMSPTVCCYRCWGRLLPESLFSSTHPRKTTNPQKQVKHASWTAQVLWAELNHDFWHKIWSHWKWKSEHVGFYIHLLSLSKTFNIQLSCLAANRRRLV